jgi:hypothetical protein
MRGAIGRVVAVCALGVIAAGCTVVRPKPWDKFHDGEVLRVHGADRNAPGQVVYRSLREQPNLRRMFEREGTPDALEIYGGRMSRKTIVLRYTRPSASPRRTITLLPAGDGFEPQRPVLMPRKRGRAPASESEAPPAKKAPAPKKSATPQPTPGAEAPGEAAPAVEETELPPSTPEPDVVKPDSPSAKPASGKRPSAEQALGCPIDPSRPDCQEFCVPGADHEWCD